MASASDARSATIDGSAKVKGKYPVNIDVMLEQLDLQDEDFNDLVLDDVEQEIQASVQWMALARVQTEKGFSHPAFFGEMRAAWNLAQVNQRQLFVVRYEKLAFFCEACGILGHGYKECGRGVYEEKELKFKKWLYADMPPRNNFRGGFSGSRGGGRMGKGGFGRGTGRGVSMDADEEEVEELKDTGTSPRKPVDTTMTDGNPNARKRVDFDEKEPAKEVNNGQIVVLNNTDIVMNTGEETYENSTSSVDSKGNKRAKKGDERNKQNLETLAGSLKGCR
ncbi:hypothetical protein ACQ4PT_031785 [Festuca glaucescens]